MAYMMLVNSRQHWSREHSVIQGSIDVDCRPRAAQRRLSRGTQCSLQGTIQIAVPVGGDSHVQANAGCDVRTGLDGSAWPMKTE